MAIPINAGATASEITLTWSALTGASTGYSPILSYSLYWDNGAGGTPSILVMNSLVYTYTITGLTAGTTYGFALEAVNLYGYGSMSSTISILASSIPQTMTALTTSLSGLTGIQITFVAPDDMGQTIDKYQIEIYDPTTGLYVEDTTYCNGASSTVISNMYCTFPISFLIATYSYTYE